MNELIITFKENSNIKEKNRSIGIFVETCVEEELLYKYLVGRNGMWKIIKDFSKDNYVEWNEYREGNYIIMVQGKKKNSEKPFDFVERVEYIINNDNIQKDECGNKIKNSDVKNLDENQIVENRDLKLAEKEVLLQNNEDVIKHILVHPKSSYCMDEEIIFYIITNKSENMLLKYKLFINDNLIEEVPYAEGQYFSFYPRCIGTYRFEFYAKSKNSTKKFDCLKEYTINVEYSKPIESIDLHCDTEYIRCNEGVTFMANVVGGKNVLYEFYMLKDDDWYLVQAYSKKNYYTFMPFKEGEYNILVLARSFHKNLDYENYSIYKFNVKPGKELVVKTYGYI